MGAIEIARRLADLGQLEDAQQAYLLAIHESEGKDPENELEAALYLFQSEYDYRIPYASFRSLYNRGFRKEDLMRLMTEAFYEPNLEPQQALYRRNCRALSKYPYIFRRDFPAFEDLPLQFFPYDDDGYLPYDLREDRFEDYVNPNHPEITHYFFKDLSKPVFASDIFSQYELEYLNDNVRKSEWCAKENHIYLHYAGWETFCAWLQVLDLTEIVKDEKFVFLFGAERSLYPIDFKEKYGIDYSQMTVKPFGLREVNRLIWHTQFSSHCGGDLFNEVLHRHPNLLAYTSVMMEGMEELVSVLLRVSKARQWKEDEIMRFSAERRMDFHVVSELFKLQEPTEKDAMVAVFLGLLVEQDFLDPAARIVPVLLFQPHFKNLYYELAQHENGVALKCEQYDAIQNSPLFQGFKYIKTFTPIRRPTTSYGAAIKEMWVRFEEFVAENDARKADSKQPLPVMTDEISGRLKNRSYLADWQNRLMADSRIVRFEDGKLNPAATFTALAEFLDIPYTESMTYCSDDTGIDPQAFADNVRGFDPATVYRTYDEWVNDDERYFLEYFLRDLYEHYGYDFHYYDGKPVDQERVDTLIAGFTTLDGFILKTLEQGTVLHAEAQSDLPTDPEFLAAFKTLIAKQQLEQVRAKRQNLIECLMSGLWFVNANGQPLRYMTLLEPDPALLEQPLYH